MSSSYLERERVVNYLPGSRGSEPATSPACLSIYRVRHRQNDECAGAPDGLGRRRILSELAGGAGYEEKLPPSRHAPPQPVPRAQPAGPRAWPLRKCAAVHCPVADGVAPVRSSGTGRPAARPWTGSELAPRVDFLDPPGDTTFRRLGVGVELENERGSHHMNDLTAPSARRCESRVQVGVKFVCEPFWRLRLVTRSRNGSTAPASAAVRQSLRRSVLRNVFMTSSEVVRWA